MSSAMKVKRLSLDDFLKIKEMDTGIEDDYVVRAFENLLQRPDNFLYGLMEDERIVTVSPLRKNTNDYSSVFLDIII